MKVRKLGRPEYEAYEISAIKFNPTAGDEVLIGDDSWPFLETEVYTTNTGTWNLLPFAIASGVLEVRNGIIVEKHSIDGEVTPPTSTSPPRPFTLVKNYISGFWELTTPNPNRTYILSQPTDDWVNVVYLIGRAMGDYYNHGSEPLPESIREVVGIKQLVGGW